MNRFPENDWSQDRLGQDQDPEQGLPVEGPQLLEGFLEFLEANYYNRGAPYEFLVWYTDNGRYPVGLEPDLDQELPDFFEGVQEQLEEWRETKAQEQELRKAHRERAKGNTIRV